MTLSTAPEESLDTIVSLIQTYPEETLLKSFGFIPDKAQLLRQTFADPDFNKEFFLTLWDDDKLRGVLFGITRPWKNPTTGYVKFMFYDDPQHGDILLKEIEHRFRKHSMKILTYGSSSPLYWSPAVPRCQTDLQKLLEKNSWQKDSSRISMFFRNYLTEDIVEQYQNDLNNSKDWDISFATESNKEETVNFVKAHFGDSWAKECVTAFDHIIPQSAVAIVRHKELGNIDGFAVLHGTNPHWFGPMGINQSLRRSGLGTLLVKAILIKMYEFNLPYLSFPWINGKEEFYSRIVKDFEFYYFDKFIKQL